MFEYGLSLGGGFLCSPILSPSKSKPAQSLISEKILAIHTAIDRAVSLKILLIYSLYTFQFITARVWRALFVSCLLANTLFHITSACR